jgi:hypothetical protein
MIASGVDVPAVIPTVSASVNHLTQLAGILQMKHTAAKSAASRDQLMGIITVVAPNHQYYIGLPG